MLFWPLSAWALTVNIDTESRCDVVGDDCPVPVAVMFRTDISDANFLIWHCEWDFGDDDSVSGGSAAGTCTPVTVGGLRGGGLSGGTGTSGP